MRLIKLLFMLVLLLLAAVIVIPLVALAGLFVWLKMTEETDDDAIELELDSAEDASQA